jgi:hypothetical protein
MSQSEREGSKVTEDKAETKERKVDDQADVETVHNAEGNVPVGRMESNREQSAAQMSVKDLWTFGFQRGYVGPTHDAQEEKEEKVKERLTKERERRKEQSKKRVPYESFVTLNGLQGATHLNGQRGRVMDKMINAGRYPVKLGNGTVLSVKEENMIREGTRGAEGKNKGTERKDLELQRRRQRKLKKIRSAKTHWVKYKVNKPHSGQGHKDVISAYRNVLEIPSARELRKIILSKRNNKRKIRTGLRYMELITPVTKRASKKGQYKRDNSICMIDKTEQKDWCKRLTNSKRNLKRQYRKGSTDVYLLKRTIELEID